MKNNPTSEYQVYVINMHTVLASTTSIFEVYISLSTTIDTR